jgi:hypothetical protein
LRGAVEFTNFCTAGFYLEIWLIVTSLTHILSEQEFASTTCVVFVPGFHNILFLILKIIFNQSIKNM